MTVANSAVTLPRSRWAVVGTRSPREGQRTMHQLGEHAPHLVTAQDRHQQPREPDRSKRSDRVFGSRGPILPAESR